MRHCGEQTMRTHGRVAQVQFHNRERFGIEIYKMSSIGTVLRPAVFVDPLYLLDLLDFISA